MSKLGLIAGAGGLPAEIADQCRAAGRPYFVIRLKGIADDGTAKHPSAEVGLAELGKCFKILRKEGCDAVCFAGVVDRPGFLGPDAGHSRTGRSAGGYRRRAQGR